VSSVVERKAGCAKEFADRLAERLRGRLYKVVLFGSVAKGTADVDSDVDVLIVVDRVSRDVEKIVAETAFQVGLRCGEAIEYILMSLEEYKSGIPITRSSTRLRGGVRCYAKTLSMGCGEL